MLLTNPVGLLMPTPLHLLAILLVVCALAFRKRSSVHRWRYLLLAAVAWCWILSTPAVAHRLTLQLERQYPPLAPDTAFEAPLILVLASGDAYEDSQPDALQLDLASFRRTQVAVSLWRETGGVLLFAGTIHRHEQRPVAERMAELARSSGVPAASIRIEARSRSTRENLQNNLAAMNARDVILVTSAAHMPRAMAVAHALGADPIAAPADFRAKRSLTWRAWLPNSQSLPLLAFALREWTGRLYYGLRGWT